MLRANVVLAFILGATVPACAQFAGPGVPSYNPGVPSYNPGVPRQAPGPVFGPGQAPGMGFRYGHVPRSAPGVPPQGRVLYGYGGYGYGGYGYGGPIVVVPQTVIIPPQRPRATMDNPFFGDLGDPFF